MKSLVTGATGFIGSHIAERLVKEGESVIALVRRSSDTSFLNSIGVELAYGDINDVNSVKTAMKGVDKVYHSAAIVGEWVSQDQAYRVNVEGTKNLLECAREANIKRFIFVSSLAVLGMRDHQKTPADAPYYKSGDPYIDTKIDAEKFVLEYQKKFNLPLTVIRPGFVFGPRDKRLIPRILDNLRKGKFMFAGNGKNKINALYIDNIIDAIFLADKNRDTIGRVYNVGNDSGMSIEEFIFRVADTWNLQRPKKHIPKSMIYFLCNILEGWAALTRAKKPPFITKTRIKFLTLNLDFDISKTREELGYRPSVDIEEGLRRTKEWLDKGAR